MIRKWKYTLILVFLFMGIYWHKALAEMFHKNSLPDMILFLLMGLVSGSLGFGVVAVADKFMGNRITKTWLSVLLSVLVSLVIVFVASNILTDIVMAT